MAGLIQMMNKYAMFLRQSNINYIKKLIQKQNITKEELFGDD